MLTTPMDLKLFDMQYEEMEKELAAAETAAKGRFEYYREIDVVREYIRKLQTPFVPEFDGQAAEVLFYSTIWPKFYAKLFFYLLAQRFCYQRRIEPSRSIEALIETEERRINHFFSRHREFWADYLYALDWRSNQYTQKYSRQQVLEPLSIILEAAGGTVAGYWVAWGLAYEQYRGWLRTMGGRSTASSGGVYEWKETKSAAAELIKSQVESESVYINGKPATAAQLRTDFEQRYHVDLKDMDNLLYAMDTLKSDETPYLSKLKQRFVAWKKRLGK